MTAKILAVDDDPVNLQLVTQVLKRQGYEIQAVDSAVKALDVVEQMQPDLILMDVMMPELDGYDATRRLRRNPKTAQIPVILLTALDTLEQKIKGFEAGADDYIPKPFEAPELIARLNAQLRRHPTGKQPALLTATTGKVIASFSLRGGVGVSTVAANLAVGLARLWGRQTVLVDLVFSAGQAALMLNLPMRNTWADMADTSLDEIDIDLLKLLLRPHPSGVQVLAAPGRPEQGELIDVKKINRVLSLLSTHYDYVILDLAHDFRQTTLAGLDASDLILGVLAPELASVRAMALSLDTFEMLEYPHDRMRLLLNWIFERQGLARADIEAGLKRPIDLVIPHAPDPTVSAINFGEPIVYKTPESPLGVLFEDMAFAVSKDEHRKTKPEHPTEAWHRVIKRLRRRRKARPK